MHAGAHRGGSDGTRIRLTVAVILGVGAFVFFLGLLSGRADGVESGASRLERPLYDLERADRSRWIDRSANHRPADRSAAGHLGAAADAGHSGRPGALPAVAPPECGGARMPAGTSPVSGYSPPGVAAFQTTTRTGANGG